MKIAGFQFNKVIIIQSLEPHEFQTGKHISDYVSNLFKESKNLIPTELINCSNKTEFLNVLTSIESDCKNKGQIPILHIDCHGDLELGLEFSNGSLIQWKELASKLTLINLATRFNLLCIFSACYGGTFLGEMGAISPAPCWCMVAPSRTVEPDEILRGFRIFYSALINHNDVGVAVHQISKLRLEKGSWFGEPSELWFEKVVSNYIEDHCNSKAIKKRALELYKSGMIFDQKISISEAKRRIKDQNRQKVFLPYFETYFMIKEIPENSKRFERVLKDLQSKFSSFESKGVHHKFLKGL